MLIPSMKVAVFLQHIYDGLLQPLREHNQIMWMIAHLLMVMPNGFARRA